MPLMDRLRNFLAGRADIYGMQGIMTRHRLTERQAMSYALIWSIGSRFQKAVIEPPITVTRVDGKTLSRRQKRIAVEALTLLNNPNDFYSGDQLIQGAALDSHFLGTGYILAPRGDDGRIHSLWWCPYERVRPRFTSDGVVEYYIAGERWPQDNVFRITNTPSRQNTLFGDGPLPHLLSEVYTDQKAILRIAAWMGNNAIPSGFIVPPAEGKVLSKADMDAIRAQWNLDAGGDQQGGIMFAKNGVKFEQVEFNPRQLDMSVLTGITETRIAAAFAMPPSELGLESGKGSDSYASEKVRSARFARSMMVPAWLSMQKQLTSLLMPEYSGTGALRYEFDTTQVVALQESKDLLHKRIRDDYNANLITLNEARLATGREEVAGGDRFADGSRPGGFDPEPGPAPDGDPPEEELLAA